MSNLSMAREALLFAEYTKTWPWNKPWCRFGPPWYEASSTSTFCFVDSRKRSSVTQYGVSATMRHISWLSNGPSGISKENGSPHIRHMEILKLWMFVMNSYKIHSRRNLSNRFKQQKLLKYSKSWMSWGNY